MILLYCSEMTAAGAVSPDEYGLNRKFALSWLMRRV